MTCTRRHVALVAALGAVLCGCSCVRDAIPAEPSANLPTSSASPVSDTDSPQPSSGHGSLLRGRILNEAGKPVEGCLVRAEGDNLEYAIVSDSSGMFEYGVPFGVQVLIITCDKRSYPYPEERVRIDVPRKKEFRQDFTVHGK